MSHVQKLDMLSDEITFLLLLVDPIKKRAAADVQGSARQE